MKDALFSLAEEDIHIKLKKFSARLKIFSWQWIVLLG